MNELLVAKGYVPAKFGSLIVGQDIRIPVKDTYFQAVIVEQELDGGTALGVDFPIMCILDGEDIVYVKD